MSKEKKPATQLDKALTFILDNFTDKEGAFECWYTGYKCSEKLGKNLDCDDCKVQKDFNEIFGL